MRIFSAALPICNLSSCGLISLDGFVLIDSTHPLAAYRNPLQTDYPVHVKYSKDVGRVRYGYNRPREGATGHGPGAKAKTETDRKMGIEPGWEPAKATKESVDQVNNRYSVPSTI
jgi:hypothetical protein